MDLQQQRRRLKDQLDKLKTCKPQDIAQQLYNCLELIADMVLNVPALGGAVYGGTQVLGAHSADNEATWRQLGLAFEALGLLRFVLIKNKARLPDELSKALADPVTAMTSYASKMKDDNLRGNLGCLLLIAVTSLPAEFLLQGFLGAAGACWGGAHGLFDNKHHMASWQTAAIASGSVVTARYAVTRVILPILKECGFDVKASTIGRILRNPRQELINNWNACSKKQTDLHLALMRNQDASDLQQALSYSQLALLLCVYAIYFGSDFLLQVGGFAGPLYAQEPFMVEVGVEMPESWHTVVLALTLAIAAPIFAKRQLLPNAEQHEEPAPRASDSFHPGA